MALEFASSSTACKTLEGGATEPVRLYGNLYYFQLWMETITARLLPDELCSAHSHTHRHANIKPYTHTFIHTPTDTQSNIQTHAESFTKDKRHPVGLRKRKREGERDTQKSNSGSLLLFHSLPLPPLR